MANDFMHVGLHLHQIRVLELLTNKPEVLRVRVESTLARPSCSDCGFQWQQMHEMRERRVRDSALFWLLVRVAHTK